MAESLIIRLATPEDLVAAGEVARDAYRADGLAPPDYQDVIADARTRARDADVLVAVRDQQVLGSVTFAVPPSPWAEIAAPGEAEFRMLGVSAQARGAGVGEALVRECLHRALVAHATRLVLCTQDTMLSAQRLYERLGFTRTPERDWDPVPGVHLLAYALVLTPADD